MAPVKKKNKRYDLKFKLSVVKFAEENSGEAAARRFSVDPKRVRDWRKSKTELQRLSEEDSSRSRLPGGGRKKASEELEKNMRDWVVGKRARQEKVSRRMIRSMAKQMYATVSDSKDEEFAASAGWLNRFLPRNNFTDKKQTTIAQKDARELTENLVKFMTCSSQTIETKKILDRDIIAMDETAVWFDIAGSTTVATRGASSVPLKTTGQENSLLTVVLAAKADGTKLKPFVVFKGAVKEVKAMQSIGGVVVASSRNGLMNDDLTADWLQKVLGKCNMGPRLLVWDSNRCHISQATREELKRGYETTTAVIPGDCTKYLQAPDVVWNQPLKASLRESYESWMAGNVGKTYIAGGKMRVPARRLLVTWVLKAWEELDTELVKKSFKVCGLNVAADGSEDHLIHCFKEGEPCAAGREMLAQARQGESEDDEAEQQEEYMDLQGMSVIKEEVSLEWSSSLDQEDPEPLHIKQEQDELLINIKEEEPLNGLEETDITSFAYTVSTVKSEDDEEKPTYLQLHQSQTEDNREVQRPTSSSETQMKTETDGEDCGGSEPARNQDSDSYPQLNTNKKDVDGSETDVSSGDWQEPLSDSESETEETDNGWEYKGSLQKHKSHLEKRSSGSLEEDECCDSLESVNAGLKPHGCDVCGKRFTFLGNFQNHMRVHTGEKPFGCDDCGKTFSQQTNLKAHMRVHTGDKPFGCDLCNVRFTFKTNLEKHMRVHTGEKPYDCADCGKRFRQKTILKTHMRVHTGERPFGCEVCGKKFTQRGNLNKHMKLH